MIEVNSYIARYPVLRTTGSSLLLTTPPPHPADIFLPTPTRPLWEAFSHAAIIARRLFVHAYPPLSVDRYLFIQLSELRQCGVNETDPASKWLQGEPNPGLPGWESNVVTTASQCVPLQGNRGLECRTLWKDQSRGRTCGVPQSLVYDKRVLKSVSRYRVLTQT